MKPFLRTSILFLVFFTCPVISVAGEALIQLEVFSLTKVRAARLLSDERLRGNPAAIIKDLGEMKVRNEAALVDTPSLRGALPLNTQVRGKISVEVDVGDDGNGGMNLNISVQEGKTGAITSLLTTCRLQNGVPKFLGTLETADPGEKNNTWIVFVCAQQR